MKMLEQSNVDKMLIKRTFEFQGYRIEDIKGKLYKLYGIELEGNNYEECANSIL